MSSTAIRIDNQWEAELLQWTIDHCDSPGSYSNIDFEEGWGMIDEYGLKFIRRILSEFLLTCNANPTPGGNKRSNEAIEGDIAKPFGYKGYASLYTISYKIAQINFPTNNALELYQRFGIYYITFMPSPSICYYDCIFFCHL